MASSSANSTFSVIGADVVVKGDISASADLHIDGTIQGDIKCASVVQGETSEIIGGVTAETARLSGKVSGSINARDLTILKSAQVEGDVHYDALTIEQGAQVDGRFAPNSQRQSGQERSAQGSSAKTDKPAEKAPKKPDDPEQATLQIAH